MKNFEFTEMKEDSQEEKDSPKIEIKNNLKFKISSDKKNDNNINSKNNSKYKNDKLQFQSKIQIDCVDLKEDDISNKIKNNNNDINDINFSNKIIIQNAKGEKNNYNEFSLNKMKKPKLLEYKSSNDLYDEIKNINNYSIDSFNKIKENYDNKEKIQLNNNNMEDLEEMNHRNISNINNNEYENNIKGSNNYNYDKKIDKINIFKSQVELNKNSKKKDYNTNYILPSNDIIKKIKNEKDLKIINNHIFKIIQKEKQSNENIKKKNLNKNKFLSAKKRCALS